MVSCPRNHLYRTPERIAIRAPDLCRELYHVCDLANELDLEAFVDRAHDDALHQPTQYLDCFGMRFRVAQGFVQVLDLSAVKLREVGVPARRGWRRSGKFPFKSGLALFEFVELGAC